MALVGTTLRGAAGQAVSARALRLGLGSLFRPGTAALAVAGGALIAAPGGMGELTLVNPTTVRVNPALWVVQGSHSGAQGQYLVPNDATVDLTAHSGQHASQFRRNLVAVTVDDSQAAGVASSGTTDRERLHVIEGDLSATAPAPLPAVPPNSLLLGEVGVPPTGQTVTVTPYNPRTTARGGILPVIDDALTLPGHGAEVGAYVGQYRDHPLYGLQRWNGTTWGPVDLGRPFGTVVGTGTQAVGTASYSGVVLATNRRTVGMTANGAGLTIDLSGWYLCSGGIEFSGAAGGRRVAGIGVNGTMQFASQNAVPSTLATSVNLATAAYPLALNAGQLVSLMGYQDSGSTLNFVRAQCFLSAHYLGPLA